MDPLRGRFTKEEMERFSSEAAERGITVSVLLRELMQPMADQDELELFDDLTLLQMWFANHRIFLAQREDVGPKEMADVTSLYSPVMSTRLEDILNRRGVYPALELDRQERGMRPVPRAPLVEPFTIVFEWDGMPRHGAGPVASISRINGVFPSRIFDPELQGGGRLGGEWEYESVDEVNKLVIFHRVQDEPRF